MRSKEKSLIIPIFLPHAACPNRCLFCSQQALHPEEKALDFSRIQEEIRHWINLGKKAHRPVELAFYGGNFLGLPEESVRDCLFFLEKELPGAGIRFSTRPDSISERSLLPFTEKKIRPIVELGVQSLDDAVLEENLRGHTAEDVLRAIGLLCKMDAEIIAQMMLGLPGADENSDLASAEKLATLPIHGVRIAPTLVLQGSGLANLHKENRYKPLDFENAVRLCADCTEILEKAKIPVIRLGLQSDEFLEKSILAGPHHPAFGEYVRGFQVRRKILSALKEKKPFHEGESVYIRISPRMEGRMRGMNKENEKFFKEAVFPAGFFFLTDTELPADAWLLEKGTHKILPPILTEKSGKNGDSAKTCETRRRKVHA